MAERTEHELLTLLGARKGHFLLESGHHGDLWLDLELLCVDPGQVGRLASELAQRLSRYECAAVCGPLIEGAFAALMTASELKLEFFYSEPFRGSGTEPLYPVNYRIPGAMRPLLQGKRVAIVNDVVNAGSAVMGTFQDLIACGAKPIALGALLVLGDWASKFAVEKGLPLESLNTAGNVIWRPAECPLCASGVPLENR
jgi:orotate phosphoribosyltransferase